MRLNGPAALPFGRLFYLLKLVAERSIITTL
jgi:hypothetical protein